MTSETAHHRYLVYAFFFINIWKAVKGYFVSVAGSNVKLSTLTF